jgi:restriction endonuclease
MLELKNYQKRSIEELEEYLVKSKQYGAEKGYKIAFIEKTDSKYNEQDLEVPFVCIKIPTGGGKTVVACHMLNSLYEKYSQGKNQKGLVIWLVPTDAIRTQTLNALQNREHPYREALDHYFSNNIKVIDFKEALSIKKSDIEDNLCILVASLAAFRITDKEGRKAYADNGNLLEHFEHITENNLDKDEDGQVKYSLVNVIKLAKPIVIIDEGHNAKTTLSFDMLKDLNPSFVLEYTATPRQESNVLVNVTASELKEEKMVKIPIYLNNIAQWQQTVRDGVARRIEIEKIAKKEKGEYIRPIALIQAEQEKEDQKKIYVQKIVDFLKEDLKIDESEIAIRTGKQDQISDVDLFSKKCPIRYILTVSALKEGWDNAFAYVLISVANIESRISVEQTIGRILRLPNTKEKKQQELNVSYVYTSSRNFKEAASNLEKGLLANGYTKKDFKELTTKIEKENIFAKSFDDKNIKVPYIAVKEGTQYRPLEYYSDLIGEDFDLSKQKPPADFIWDFDQNRTQKVDVKEGDLLERSAQTKLDVVYEHKDFSKERLLNWLDKKVLRKEYAQDEKRIFFEKLIDDALATKQYTLSELSINCYKLKEIIEDYIDQLEYEKSSATFSKLEKDSKLSLDKVHMEFPDSITIDNTSEDRFTKHLYERAGTLNSEELELALKIDQIDNVMWWYRSMEKKDFFMQGWRRDKFYPDYIVKTNSGKYLIVEYKGENLLTNEDTKYKVELGKKWKELAGKDYEFYLVSKKNMEEFIAEIKKI